MRKLLLGFTLTLLMVPAQDAAAQARRVTGQVTNLETFAPVSGAQVMVKGTTVGTLTDAGGNYVLTVPAGANTLVFTLIGFRTSEVPITGEVVNVTLAPEAVALEGVVVTAMGITQKERAIGTSVQSVSAEQLVQAREVNLVSALSGRAAGVDVRSTGTQGGSARIVIRGASSIQGNNQPLFIVDGLPIDNSMCQGARCITGGAGAGGNQGSVDYGNAAQDINPNDIESITILKGPNAAALYGSRAANGAIVITTKAGRSALGRSGGLITVSQNVSFETPLRLPSYQNQFGQGSRGEFSFVDGKGGGINDGTDESWGPPLDDGRLICQFDSPGAGTANCQPTPWVSRPNNVRDFFQTGRTLTTNVAFSAANEDANVRLSVTNMDQDGMYPEMRIKRLTTALNAGAQLGRARVDGSAQYIRGEGNNRPGVGYLGTNPMQQFVWFGRQVDMQVLRNYRNPDGTLFNWNHQYFGNPFFMATENRNQDQRDRVMGSVGASYQFTPWLSARLSSGTDWYEDYRRRTYAHGNIGLAFAQRGGLYEQQIYRQETNYNFIVTANQNLTPDITMTANVGAGRAIGDARFHNVGTNQLLVPDVYNFANAVTTPTPGHEVQQKRINSLYGQAQFGFRNYWFVDVTGRNDWSSTLPEGNNAYFYPSISTSLVVSDLVPGLRQSPLSFAKLRASWARVGNDADPYQTSLVYSSATAWGGSTNFTVPNRLPSLDLKPEETNSIEVGTDLRFFDNRLGFDVTYYSAETKNQILPIQVSATSGYTSRVINAGTMTNRGVELLASIIPVRTRGGFQWEVTANYARNENEVKELYEGLETLVLGTYWSLNVEAREGHPYGVLWGRQFVRDPQGRIVVGENGLPINANTNPNGILGNYNPDWTGSLTNSFRYRNLDLSFLLDTQQGGSVFSVTQMFGNYAGVLPETLEGRCGGPNLPPCETHGYLVPNSVKEDGTANTTRVPAELYHHSLFGLQEPFVLDASFTKLREVRLGYAVPASISERMRISNMHVSVVGRNLWLKTPMPHIDPEVAFDASNVQGLEFGSLPSARSFGFHLTVTP
jgi:TonB-linked SusC/RagA family outer membrane protein